MSEASWRAKVDNMRLAWREFGERRLTLASRPFKAILELTQNCNFRCAMCPQSFDPRFARHHPEYNMPMETFVAVAGQLFPTAIMIDLRGFGETTILPHWPEVVDHLADYPYIEWHLVTNLSLPRADTWRKMVGLGFTLGFSCDGATAETFERVRARARFDRILANLELITGEIRSQGRGLLYFISTMQKSNAHEMRALVELAARHGVPEVQFKAVQSGMPGFRLDELPAGELRAHASAAVDAALDLGVRATFNDRAFTDGLDAARVARAGAARPRANPHPFPSRPVFGPAGARADAAADREDEEEVGALLERVADAHRVSAHQRCFKPFSYTYVNYRAEMGTCNHMMYPDMLVMGDLARQPLGEIWNGPGYRDFRRQLLEAAPRDPRCQWCFRYRLDD